MSVCQKYPVTPENMNFAIVPFVIVIGLAILAYMVSGRKWFTGPIRNVEA